MISQALAVPSTIDFHNDIAYSFVRALAGSECQGYPYDHWILKDILPPETLHAITALPFVPPEGMIFNGRRESNNSKRVYFTRENQEKFKVCRDFARAFDGHTVREAIEEETGANLSDSILRVEYCQDTGDFWLEPHTDISVKKFTLLIYLSGEPELSNCGTDIYDASPEHKLVYSAPYEADTGVIFIPAHNTWHGFSKRRINGVRKSLIVNYVSPEWRDKWELSY